MLVRSPHVHKALQFLLVMGRATVQTEVLDFLYGGEAHPSGFTFEEEVGVEATHLDYLDQPGP